MTIERAEDQSAEPGTPLAAAQPGPRGIGTGVAFDWALTVQIVLVGVFTVLGTGPGALGSERPIGLRLVAAFVSFLFAAVIFTQGEALRRGRRAAWMIQIAANALLVLEGLTEIPVTVESLKMGQVSHLVRLLVLLVVSPLIAWLLTRQATRAWIGRVSSAEARARHGGSWLVWIALWAIIGGAAIAFVGYY